MVRQSVLALRANETGDADVVKLLEQQAASQYSTYNY